MESNLNTKNKIKKYFEESEKVRGYASVARAARMFENDSLDLIALFQYGISCLPDQDEENGDSSISKYFLAISELDGLPEEARDFAIDVSVYASGAYSYDARYKTLNPDKLFKEKIRPLLS